MTRKAATAAAERLKVASPGVVVAETVATGEPLYGSWEDTHVDIWGPRTGKTTARAIPAISTRPGRCWSPPTNATWSTPPATCASS
ncbi:MAG TPA: hypothetical protein VFP34_15465 [Microlunatus sp.]|nr:hypothetical protein [Microlunatus sp.]